MHVHADKHADKSAEGVAGAFGKLTFADLSLHERLQTTIAEQGYTQPTPIQAKAIPVALAGRDILGSAQTGTGKTAAFALPILHKLMTAPVDKTRRGPVLPRALILAPTRELAQQILESFGTYGKDTGLRGTAVYGGMSMFHQIRALKSGVDVLVATPGRLIDLLEQGHVKFDDVQVFVLDEADRMLDMGFIHPIKRIASELPKDKPRQTMLFSATMPSEIKQLAHALLKDPQQIAVAPVSSTASRIEQRVYAVDKSRKLGLLAHLLGTNESPEAAKRSVVFTRTKFGAERLAQQLERLNISSDAIHGNKAQNQRKRALSKFKDGSVRVLVATDVAARGLDVDDVSHVFNFDLPTEPEAYVHRIGRTGRAGSSGLAISFVTPDDFDALRDIQRVTKAKIQVITSLPQGLMRTQAPRMDGTDDVQMPERRYGQPGRPAFAGAAGHSGPRTDRPGIARGPRPGFGQGGGSGGGHGGGGGFGGRGPSAGGPRRMTRNDLGLPPRRP